MYTEIFGTGTPLLFIHGGNASLESFFCQIPTFAKKFRIILVETRGNGRSSDDEQPFNYHQIAEDIIKLLDILQISQVNIIGWSDGGIIGIDLALFHPERLLKVITIGVNTNPDGIHVDMLQKMKYAPWNMWNDPKSEKNYRALSPTPDRFLDFIEKIRILWTTLPQYSEEQLRKIRNPFLILAGEKEEFIQSAHTKWIAEQISTSKLKILPNLTHSALIENPKLLNKIMLEYLLNI